MSEGPGPDRVGRRETWIVAGMGLAAVLPFLVYHAMFARLFWFGDEMDLIDQFDRMGFWKWVWLVFAENFVPLFKALWGGAVYAGGGSYLVLLTLLWLTHGLTVAWLGRLMRGCGFGWIAVISSQLVFGLAPSNYETLGWTVQGSAVLALTFQLIALDTCFRGYRLVWPVAGVVASALSFSRGVLSGPLVAMASWLGGPRSGRWLRTALFLAPALSVALLITFLAKGNHQHMRGHLVAASVFGLWYFCLDPTYELFRVASWGWRTAVILGVLKVGLYGWGLRRGQGRQRHLIAVLLAFDLGNAVLLGIGRYHTGIFAAVSSRYQYSSLVAVLPAAGFALEAILARLPLSNGRRGAALCVAGAALAIWLVARWPIELDHFTKTRGSDSRRILFVDANPDPHSVPGIPFLPMSRAKELIAKYHLH